MTQRHFIGTLSGILLAIMLGLVLPTAMAEEDARRTSNARPTNVLEVDAPQLLVERDGKLYQLVRLKIQQTGKPADIAVHVRGN